MVFLGLGVLFPRATSLRLAAGALAISWVVELTQLYQAPWINGVRRTTMGHLVLGSTFAWLDLVSYAAGAGLALGGEWAIRWLFRAHRSPPVMISPFRPFDRHGPSRRWQAFSVGRLSEVPTGWP